ncbi:MAG: hypothetical protein KDJ86_06470 [Bauldia sp.]|uniref:hypothetical protein n=1 Tax=Bauldia sp. TaxID=2575872 RepID=UPI001D300A29|nr:hypothetical protein [Bauldia sp.]MCB1495410.1 hypothetical protein [Bauldia sp.]
MRAVLLAFLVSGLCAAPSMAGEADVVDVVATQEAGGTWRFDVTVRHDDEGWDHYADAWEIRGADGTVYGTRTLLHPHENEQPFTRSLGGVAIPEGVDAVEIAAHDSVHAFGGRTMRVTLRETAGD